MLDVQITLQTKEATKYFMVASFITADELYARLDVPYLWWINRLGEKVEVKHGCHWLHLAQGITFTL